MTAKISGAQITKKLTGTGKTFIGKDDKKRLISIAKKKGGITKTTLTDELRGLGYVKSKIKKRKKIIERITGGTGLSGKGISELSNKEKMELDQKVIDEMPYEDQVKIKIERKAIIRSRIALSKRSDEKADSGVGFVNSDQAVISVDGQHGGNNNQPNRESAKSIYDKKRGVLDQEISADNLGIKKPTIGLAADAAKPKNTMGPGPSNLGSTGGTTSTPLSRPTIPLQR